MLLSKIQQIISGCSSIVNADLQPYQGPDLEISSLLTDSRQLGSDPSHTLFFALHTSHDDGARYIHDLSQRGVQAFVVTNSLDALQALAAYKRSEYQGIVIGITGSNGKTVVKEWLYELLKDDYEIVRSPKSYNSQIGVPLSVWLLPEASHLPSKPQLAIFEAGISKPGEMERLERMIRPTLGVVTFIGEEHGENFPSLQAKREEKMRLFAHTPTIIEDPSHQNVRTCAAVMRALGYSEEVISQRILHQTHETVLQINLSALVDNVRYFRSFLHPETQLVCMVKAFAYGAGSIEVSRALEAASSQQQPLVNYLAVAVADEGVELRKAGIRLPIIVMDPEEMAMNLIIENNLEPNIYSFQSLDSIIHAVTKKGIDHFPIHIKIDSGMHRLGFYQTELPELLSVLKSNKAVRVVSVFSHLATADDLSADAYTLAQIAYFQACAEQIKCALPYPIKMHILNSAGIERFSQYQFDMCRLGIGLYGFSCLPVRPSALRNVCTLKTTILSVKSVAEGEAIGYGRHTILTSARQIAVIPIGYADGFDRRFSNYGGEVMVRGKRCPVVGNVCMDQTMIDVTDTDAQPGDYAIIFGDNLPIESLADRLETIPYEILTSVSRRVQRQYFYE